MKIISDTVKSTQNTLAPSPCKQRPPDLNSKATIFVIQNKRLYKILDLSKTLNGLSLKPNGNRKYIKVVGKMLE